LDLALLRAPSVQVLVANAGSSSLKLSVIGEGAETLATTELGDPSGVAVIDAVLGFVAEHPGISAAGHRIVHGGPHLTSPVVVDEGVRALLDVAAKIAPLHDPPALRILDALREHTGVPQVACFDTGFHASMPQAATTYAIPAAWREQHGIRRYGFHGLSCAWSLRRASTLLGRPSHELQMIVAHLGSGASATAIRDAHSVDTSMGFSPLEGLVMAKRSGTVDPGALLWLQMFGDVGVDEIANDLEHASGTLGLAGTADMRELLARAGAGDLAAMLARDVYVHRARQVIAGIAASLDRLDAIVFTGGVGENADEIRGAICQGLGVLGVQPPDQLLGASTDGAVSGSDARIAVLVIRAREDLEIDRAVRALIP
jgi:acetate kinase